MNRILVIDDDPIISRLVKAALDIAKVEHGIDYSSDGGQGMVRTSKGGYDLICLDLTMPFMDGFEALEEIKRKPQSAQIPVVVITGVQETDVHQRVMALGAAAIVTKPFNPTEFADVLQQVLAGEKPTPPQSRGPGGGMRHLGT